MRFLTKNPFVGKERIHLIEPGFKGQMVGVAWILGLFQFIFSNRHAPLMKGQLLNNLCQLRHKTLFLVL